MFCLLMYTATIVPVRIPFEDEASLGWLVIDIMTDTFFFFDIFVNFLSAYEDENGEPSPLSSLGEPVTSLRKIASTYVRSWLIIDLLSCIPFSLIRRLTRNNGIENMQLLKLSKLPRMYRLLRLIKLMRLYKSSKFIQKIINYFRFSVGMITGTH